MSTEESLGGDEGVRSSDNQTIRPPSKRRKKTTPRIVSEVRLPGLIFPESMYKSYDAPDIFDTEEAVLSDLLVS